MYMRYLILTFLIFAVNAYAGEEEAEILLKLYSVLKAPEAVPAVLSEKAVAIILSDAQVSAMLATGEVTQEIALSKISPKRQISLAKKIFSLEGMETAVSSYEPLTEIKIELKLAEIQAKANPLLEPEELAQKKLDFAIAKAIQMDVGVATYGKDISKIIRAYAQYLKAKIDAFMALNQHHNARWIGMDRSDFTGLGDQHFNPDLTVWVYRGKLAELIQQQGAVISEVSQVLADCLPDFQAIYSRYTTDIELFNKIKSVSSDVQLQIHELSLPSRISAVTFDETFAAAIELIETLYRVRKISKAEFDSCALRAQTDSARLAAVKRMHEILTRVSQQSKLIINEEVSQMNPQLSAFFDLNQMEDLTAQVFTDQS